MAVKLEPGSNIECSIARIGKNSLWVRLPTGEIGKVPAEELSWSLRPVNLHETYHLNQPLRAIVHRLPPDGPPILSLRRVQDDPWANAAQRFPPGKPVSGQVIGIEDFGAFVELDEAHGLVGLVHISQLGPKERYEKPEEAVLVGDHVQASVTQVSVQQRRLSLSIRDRLRSIEAETGRAYKIPNGDTAPAESKEIAAAEEPWMEPPLETVQQAQNALREEALARFKRGGGESGDLGLTILVVDDNSEVRTSWSEILPQYHHRVITTDSGEEAVKLAREEKPDAVLVDFAMKPAQWHPGHVEDPRICAQLAGDAHDGPEGYSA